MRISDWSSDVCSSDLPGGGDPDAVIIKDISNGAHCAVTGPAPGVADAFVAGVNAALGLRAPQEFPSDGNIASSGAFGICGVLASAIPAISGLQLLSTGVGVNTKGTTFPQAPHVKVLTGVTTTAGHAEDMTPLPRADIP